MPQVNNILKPYSSKGQRFPYGKYARRLVKDIEIIDNKYVIWARSKNIIK